MGRVFIDDWEALAAAGEDCETLSATLRDAQARRDQLVMRLSEAGVPRREVARLARLTVGRVQQIVSGEPDTAPLAPSHMQALAQANRVRLARAELKRQVAEGERSVADVVLAPPWEAESMAIADLLMSQHRWGRIRCRRFLSSIPMSEDKTIGAMTDRQRRALAARLGEAPATDTDPFGVAAQLSWGPGS